MTGLIVASAVIVLDQATKWWVVTIFMDPPRVVDVWPFFNVVMVWNRGVTFGFLGDTPYWGQWALVGLSLAIVAILLLWLRRAETKWRAAAIGLIIGGALGNVIDRVHYGAVADFLDFHVAGYHWPAFNFADAAITVGVAIMFFDALFKRKETVK
ncbi:MAG: signal peptidase II [Proteobacteria bacterium]|nr:signal peptidase II [Pseudomonadota bacterium]MCH8091018.1 signal peptidase II [Pseudomonadota bacterium]MCH8097766.1 signal peptidase II [Pseudomonadota bacterium]